MNRIALVLIAIAFGVACAAEPYDLLVRGGRIADGTGNPAYFADVAVRGGRIVAIGKLTGAAKETLDATGLVVAPGFIDVHTHAENVVQLPRAENFVRMGVTSLVTGNCGGSRLDVGAFLQQVEGKVSVNVATLIGHNTVRSDAMGGSFDRAPTDEELEKMKQLVERAMRDGAVGLSTGLIYLPGTFSQTEEIIELAKVAAAHDGIYASHMRNEGRNILDALSELFRIAREGGLRADVSHLKLSGRDAWGRADEVLAAIEQARADGLDVTHDQYAYTASSTSLGTLIPSSAREGGAAKFRERIDNPVEKAKIVAAMKAGRPDGYAYAMIASYPPDKSLNGKTVPEAAKLKRGSDSLDDQIEWVLEMERNGGGQGVFHSMNEDDLQKFLRHPHTMIASDSGVREINETLPHPRGYGNNARVLARYVRELKLLRLEDAIRKMTSLPATSYRLRDRGVVREGAWADLIVFDPNTVQEVATFKDPHHYATGFAHVFVNGIEVVREDEHTGALAGRALRLER